MFHGALVCRAYCFKGDYEHTALELGVQVK